MMIIWALGRRNKAVIAVKAELCYSLSGRDGVEGQTTIGQ